jgi:hypothetical protein
MLDNKKTPVKLKAARSKGNHVAQEELLKLG